MKSFNHFIGILVVGLMPVSELISAETCLNDEAIKSIVQKAGVKFGVCSIPENASIEPALAIASNSQMVVHCQNDKPEQVLSARRTVSERGLLGSRIYFDTSNAQNNLLSDNFANILILPDFTPKHDAAEIIRVLTPGGKAFLGNASTDKVKKAFNAQPTDNFEEFKDAAGNNWVIVVKKTLPPSSDWTHWAANADNNPISQDPEFKPPYQFRFIETPELTPRSSMTLAAFGKMLTLGGPDPRNVASNDWTIICRDGFNGMPIWKQSLKENFRTSAVCISQDSVFCGQGKVISVFDLNTGKEANSISISSFTESVKWIGIDGSVLYCIDNSQETNIAAFDLEAGRLLWSKKAESNIHDKMIGARNGLLVFYETSKRISCLNGKTGNQQWTSESPDLLENLDGPKLLAQLEKKKAAAAEIRKLTEQTNGNPDQNVIKNLTKQAEANLRLSLGTDTGLILTPKLLFIRAMMSKKLMVLSFADGKLLKQYPISPGRDNMGVYWSAPFDRVYAVIDEEKKATPVTLDSASGEILTKGEPDWVAQAFVGQCQRPIASQYGIFRSERLYNRSDCGNGVVIGNSMAYSVASLHCGCIFPIYGQTALASGKAGADSPKIGDSRPQQQPDFQQVKPFPVSESDWHEYRADRNHSAGTPVSLHAGKISKAWEIAGNGMAIAPPVAANGMIFLACKDGLIKCVSAENGKIVWSFPTGGAIRLPPTIHEGRAYAGSADGYLYCLEAATGRLLWTFRPDIGPRRLMNVYGHLSDSRPVLTGVLVKDNIAYAGCGFIKEEGNCLFSVDAVTGQPKWQNATSNKPPANIVGVSMQGDLAVAGNKLVLAGHAQPAPAAFDVETGKHILPEKTNIWPFYAAGREVMLFRDRWIIYGGACMLSGSEPIESFGWSFSRPITWTVWDTEDPDRSIVLNPFGRTAVPPAWDRDLFVMPTYLDDYLYAWNTQKLAAWFEKLRSGKEEGFELFDPGKNDSYKFMRLDDKNFRMAYPHKDTEWGPIRGAFRAITVCANAVIATVTEKGDKQKQIMPKYFLRAYNKSDGRLLWEEALPDAAQPDCLCVDRDGRIIVGLVDGRTIAFVVTPEKLPQ